jgi:hypothetical protein
MPWSLLSRAHVPKNTSAVSFILRPLYLFASVSPLAAAVIAPLAVLLDIPALTVGNQFQSPGCRADRKQEKWYTRNGQPQSDPRASLILSGLSLGFSLVANALLVIRFSLQGRKWMIATQMSVACWLVKVCLLSLSSKSLTDTQPGSNRNHKSCRFWSLDTESTPVFLCGRILVCVSIRQAAIPKLANIMSQLSSVSSRWLHPGLFWHYCSFIGHSNLSEILLTTTNPLRQPTPRFK